MHSSSDNKPFTLERAIEKLTGNHPEFKELHLNSIIINPTHGGEGPDGRPVMVSHIRDEDLYQLSKALEKNNTLQTIWIDGIGPTRSLEWSSAGAGAVGQSLSNHPKLKTVRISMATSSIDEKKIIGFLHCLKGTANIEQLRLNIYCNTNHFMNDLGHLLQSKRKSLKSIYIKGDCNKAFDKKGPLKDFYKGLGSQKELQNLYLYSVGIHGQDMAEFSEAMQEVASLKSLELGGFGIQSEVKYLCSIANNNLFLTKLNLSYNPLGERGIKELCELLPSLKKLKDLGLGRVQLNNAALDCLVTTYLEQKLNFQTLDLSCNAIDDDTIQMIMKLIDGNMRLKRLKLNACGIDDAHLQTMKPLLIDPKRCQLESFHFSSIHEFSLKTYNDLLTILDRNEFMCDLLPPRLSSEHRIACDINLRKKYLREWEMYINMTMCLLNPHRSPSHDPRKASVSSIPLVMIYTILFFLSPKTPHMQADSLWLCTERVRNNLEARQKLINEKKYDPKKDLKENSPESNKEIISQWWYTSIIDSKKNSRTLFFSSNVQTPNFMKLKDILEEIKPILSLVNNSPARDAENKEISFNISQFTTQKMLRIRDVFARFLEIQYRRHSGFMSMPTVNVHVDRGILTIQGITLAQLKTEIIRSLEPPVARNQFNQCKIM